MLNQTQYIMDTGIVLDYLAGKLPSGGMSFMDEVVNNIPNLSILSQIELLSLNMPDDYSNLVAEFVQDAIILDLSQNVVKNTIALSKTHNLSFKHAALAATAITYNYTLIVNDEFNYIYIKGLKIVNPNQL